MTQILYMIFWILIILITSFFMGASIGSFLGVVIDRLPRKESIILNASHCTNCGTKIKWYQNIPVISYIYLKGKCSNCESKIPAKFFIIEITSGLIFLVLAAILLNSSFN